MTTDVVKMAMDAVCRASVGTVLAVRAGGALVTDQRRDELLAKCRAGEYVELEIDLLAYEQKTGERNRNFVRFRDQAMLSLGRTGKGTPLLRDHAQDDLLARAGTVIASKTDSGEGGSYQVHQTAKVTSPWAVEALLRGTLDRFSIGWNPTGLVLCSACMADWRKCWHMPGDTLERQVGDDGKERLVRASAGSVVIELIFTSAELVETSAVSVPAVPTAQIEGIRAALAAQGFGLSNRGTTPHEDVMKSKLIALLGLAATVGEDEITTAVEVLRRERDTARAELAVAESDRVRLSAIVEAHQATERRTAEDAFIRAGVDERRIAEDDAPMWRDLFQANEAKAKERMAALKPGRMPGKAGAAIIAAPKQRDSGGGASGAVPAQLTPRQKKLAADAGLTDEQWLAAQSQVETRYARAEEEN